MHNNEEYVGELTGLRLHGDAKRLQNAIQK